MAESTRHNVPNLAKAPIMSLTKFRCQHIVSNQASTGANTDEGRGSSTVVDWVWLYNARGFDHREP